MLEKIKHDDAHVNIDDIMISAQHGFVKTTVALAKLCSNMSSVEIFDKLVSLNFYQ